eukprot:m.152354 g.152354  ORF g.152354 m.152354 type:complete len:50 (-) comp24542_c1_seq1:83-232(-)
MHQLNTGEKSSRLYFFFTTFFVLFLSSFLLLFRKQPTKMDARPVASIAG